jgi:UDPglucose 6-dehydrogenase
MEAFHGADCAVLMVAHSAYRDLDLGAASSEMAQPRMVDARGLFKTENLKAAGFTYRTIGVGVGSTDLEHDRISR